MLILGLGKVSDSAPQGLKIEKKAKTMGVSGLWGLND